MSQKKTINNDKINTKSLIDERDKVYDFVTLFFICALLVIDFMPYFEAMEIIWPQFLYLSLLNLSIGLFLYLNNGIASLNIIPILKKSYISIAYLAFLFFCALSILFAKNKGEGITNLIEIIIVFCIFINLSILLKNRLHLFYKICFIIGISTFFQASQELYNLIIISNKDSVIKALTSFKGNTGNINILAASLAIKIPFLLIGIGYFQNKKKWFLYLTFFFALTSVFLTAARTPLISLSLIFCIYIFFNLKVNSFKKSSLLNTGIVLLVVIFSLVTTSFVFKKTNNVARFNSLENRIKAINTDEASANARIIYWNNSIKLGKTSPIVGVGLGNYPIESLPYERELSNGAVVSLKSHNDFLEIFAETGLLNCLIYFSIFAYVFFINIKRIIKSNEAIQKTIAVTSLMLVIVYGTDAFFNFPMYRPTMQIFFGLCLALTLINTPFIITENQQLKSRKKIALILISLAIITSYFAFENYKASNLEYLIKTDDIDANAKGVLTGDEVIKRLPKYKTTFGTSQPFYEYAAIYYLKEGNYEKAHKYFSRASKINPYMGRINFYKHIISNNKGDIDSAYIYTKEAFHLRPRNLQFYQTMIKFAAIKKDTLEIMKSHNLISKYITDPKEWNITAVGLQSAGYQSPKLLGFMDQGLKLMPNDSLLIKQKNNFLITDYIIEGQKYVSQFQLDKALESYNKGLKLDPENIFIMQNLGFYYINLKQYKQAIPYLLNALKYPGLNDGKTEYYTGVCYINIKDIENACKYFNLSKAKNFSNAQQQLDQYCSVNKNSFFIDNKN